MRQLLERVRGLERSLRALDLVQARRPASEAIAKRIEAAIVESLSHRSGGEHATPWERSGALRASIASDVSATAIVVGSTDPTAVFQEAGTRTLPPRPFLAPAALSAGPDAADEIGAASAAAVREALR